MMRSLSVAGLACKRLALIGIGSGLLALSLTGCPGSLDPALMGGTGVGGGGDQGTGGNGTACNADTILTTRCAQPACHSNAFQSAGLNLTPPVAAATVVGVPPDPSSSTCTSGTFLDANSNPATGIILTNLQPNPPCGSQMPFAMTPLQQADIDCLQMWANGLVGAPGQ